MGIVLLECLIWNFTVRGLTAAESMRAGHRRGLFTTYGGFAAPP